MNPNPPRKALKVILLLLLTLAVFYFVLFPAIIILVCVFTGCSNGHSIKELISGAFFIVYYQTAVILEVLYKARILTAGTLVTSILGTTIISTVAFFALRKNLSSKKLRLALITIGILMFLVLMASQYAIHMY